MKNSENFKIYLKVEMLMCKKTVYYYFLACCRCQLLKFPHFTPPPPKDGLMVTLFSTGLGSAKLVEFLAKKK